MVEVNILLYLFKTFEYNALTLLMLLTLKHWADFTDNERDLTLPHVATDRQRLINPSSVGATLWFNQSSWCPSVKQFNWVGFSEILMLKPKTVGRSGWYWYWARSKPFHMLPQISKGWYPTPLALPVSVCNCHYERDHLVALCCWSDYLSSRRSNISVQADLRGYLSRREPGVCGSG